MSTETDKSRSYLSATTIGLILCLFAAATILTTVYKEKSSYERFYTSQKSAEIYTWYQTKNIKQILLEGQLDVLEGQNDVLHTKKNKQLNVLKENLQTKIDRLKKDQQEILAGSTKVGKANWSQTINNKLGQVIGADEWRNYSIAFNKAEKSFGDALIFLNLSLILGAISLLSTAILIRWSGFTGMLLMGIIGIIYTIQGYSFFITITY